MLTRVSTAITIGVLAASTVVAGCSAARPAASPSPHGWWGSSRAPTAARRHDLLARQLRRELRSGPSAAAQPAPPARRTTACRHNSAPRFVRVSLRRQRLWMCARHDVVRSVPITSGMTGQYTHTPTGHYAIQALERNQTLTLVTGQQYVVKYWIPFDAPLFGFHDAPWQTVPYGSRKYRTDGSHGCVHMPLHAIAFLYRWARVGTPVTIRR